MRTIKLTESEAAEILDYLDAAGMGYSEYGASQEAFDELDAMKRRIRMALYGAEDTPWVDVPPTAEELKRREETNRRWKPLNELLRAFSPRDAGTPFLDLATQSACSQEKIVFSFGSVPDSHRSED